MKRTLRWMLLVGLVGLLSAFAVTGGALAGSSGGTDPQVVDISHQLSDMQKKLNDLLSRGRLAKAGKLAAAADCGYGDSSQVFLPWGDLANYALVPQGDLGDTGGWSFKNVGVSDEHDPFTPGTRSLLFTKGDSEAVTPAMCVNLDNPTLRLFLADRGGNGKSHLEVNVMYEDLDGNAHNLTLARLKVGPAWQPSVIVPIGVNLLSAASASGWTPVSFDFKVNGLQKGETFSLDGVYVDPCRSR